ncbi:CoxG family protein [Tropicimonas sp.]|uniref:CoxG family protein n=1 Tax=Tropicimonas sp. TaxID=2067044 RepID=UPI003A8BB440
MDMTGEYRIDAARDKVWAALNDAGVLKACIPGCEELAWTGDTTLAAEVVQKIGPVKARFKGEVELLNIVPSESYTIQGEGKGGVAGFAKGAADVTLAEDSDGTVLAYVVHAQVGGKLAQLGNRLINSTSKKLAGKFFDNFSNHLNGNAIPAGEAQQD